MGFSLTPRTGNGKWGTGGDGITWACAVSMRRRASGRKRARRESTICLAAPPAPASWGEEAEACGVELLLHGRAAAPSPWARAQGLDGQGLLRAGARRAATDGGRGSCAGARRAATARADRESGGWRRECEMEERKKKGEF